MMSSEALHAIMFRPSAFKRVCINYIFTPLPMPAMLLQRPFTCPS